MGAVCLRYRSWLMALVGILLVGLVVPLGPAAVAGAGADTVPAAVTAAVEAAGVAAPAGISVAAALERKQWSFGTAVVLGTEQGDGPPDVVFYIARHQGRGWQAAIEADQAAFSQLVTQAPAGFVPEVFQPVAPAGVGAQAWNKLSDLELVMPFKIGETWTFVGGPHDEFGAATWNSIDLAPQGGGANGAVYPAYAGWATTPCKISESDGGPLVVVRHLDGWETHYFHLVDTVPMKKSVTLNTMLGRTSARSEGGGCFGTATGPHVHFSLHKTGRPGPSNFAIKGLWLGGYQINAGVEAYDGTLTKKIYTAGGGSQTVTINRGGAIYNNGEFGSGAYIRTAKLVEGQKGELRFGHMPPRSQIRLTLVYTPPGGGDQITTTIKTITTNGGGGHRVVKFTVPKANNRVIEIYARRVQAVGADDLVFGLRRTVEKR